MNVKHTTLLSFSILLCACSTSVVSHEEGNQGDVPPPDTEIEFSDNEAGENTAGILYADLSQSTLSFVGAKGNLISHEGEFTDFSFRMELDPENPSNLVNAHITLTIQIDSMKTDSEKLTSHLLSDDFFAAKTHPVVQFISHSIAHKENNNYVVTGTLTMKSIEQSISFDAEITDSHLTMSTLLDRTDYGIGPAPEGLKAIDAAVPITAKIIF